MPAAKGAAFPNSMKTTLRVLFTGALAAPVFSFAATASTPSDSAILNRGKYLVENIGMCADCHSPRNERGEFIAEAHLGGAALGFAPLMPMPVWAPVAPPIAGLPTMTDEQAVAFFMSAQRPDGSVPRPPMPAYHLSKDDAVAITTYLKSLSPSAGS